MITKVLEKVFGSKYERDINKIKPLVYEINQHFEELKNLSDDQLQGKTEEFRERLNNGETLDDLLPEAYAVVKETCRRFLGKSWDVCGQMTTWDMVPYDVQLIGAVVLHQGKITEMATGEGKTLVATMPIYLNSLDGKGVHLVTVNDFLARRDASWMGPIYDFLGLKVGVIQDRYGDVADSMILVRNGDDYRLDKVSRREAYEADVVFGTNTQFGFDYLYDNMAFSADELVQGDLHYAIIDEVDSVLIDEARTPLIISGAVSGSTKVYQKSNPMVEKLVLKQTDLINRFVSEAEALLKEEKDYEAGIKLLQVQRGAPKNRRLMRLQQEEGIKRLIEKVELDFMREKRMPEIDEDLLYVIDEKSHTADLTDKGRLSLSPEEQDFFIIPDLSVEIQKIEEDESLSLEEKVERQDSIYKEYAEKSDKIHSISQLLKAYSLYEKDVEYVVKDGHVMIVDEFTGRLMPGRRYSDGLHQAIEAKEKVKVEGETQTVATITLQNYFRMYDKLAGMTGTAETEANEFYQIYKLDVIVIPTNEPVRRVDYNDVIYRTRREKYNAIIDEIVRLNERDLPVLVGTVSVQVSETLGRMLRMRGINHEVLNAKHHQREAEIVARAGQPGSVTIATNMAGRGTDIKLGPGVVNCEECCCIDDPNGVPEIEEFTREECLSDIPCGLHIIGTARHEARRIDRQLRGRSGRQGDPGASRFFLSLEDDLMRLFGSDRVAAILDKFGAKEGEVIEHKMVTRAIERAQKRVEAQNFEIRKHLLEYDDVMNKQREVIYTRRHRTLLGEDMKSEVEDMIEEMIDYHLDEYIDPKIHPEGWDIEGLRLELRSVFMIDLPIDPDNLSRMKVDDLRERISRIVHRSYQKREELVGEERMREFERIALLSTIHDKWKEHLYEMDQLKEGISLRAYGQKDPLIEYKREAYGMFEELLIKISEDSLKILFRSPIAEPTQASQTEREHERLKLVHQDTTGMGLKVGVQNAPAEEDDLRSGSTSRGSMASDRGGSVKPAPVRTGKKIGRNDPCPCGSGKKYKKCCGRLK